MANHRVFIIRHGETDWSLASRHMGTTDIPLTANGTKRAIVMGRALVGDDRLIAPKSIANVYVSPRLRARRTFELLNLECQGSFPWKQHGERTSGLSTEAHVEITNDLQEWDYGDYEVLTNDQINQQRAERGHSEGWDLWKDGCPGGESPTGVETRVDRLVEKIRNGYHQPNQLDTSPRNIVLVAHAHILSAFAIRWTGQQLPTGPSFIVEPGGVGILGYEHGMLTKPAIVLGTSFFVDIAEK
ncbi:histidine phosphatase superfamily [Xylariales sp. PMI_506]|nr:histidine phosphatase superfamily [Xylariales sp. PMI_506]